MAISDPGLISVASIVGVTITVFMGVPYLLTQLLSGNGESSKSKASKDIEEVIIQHPAVAEVSVFGVPDKKWGETPVAAIIFHHAQNLSQNEIITWTNERVDAKFQRISAVQIYDSFPRNVAGKTLKREMRESYINK